MEEDQFDFYEIISADYSLVKSGVECESEDQNLGDKDSLSECAKACRETSECRYFIFGTGDKEGGCWWEKAENKDCPKGWEEDQYDFYEMISKFLRISF